MNDADTRRGGSWLVMTSLRPSPAATEVTEIEVDPRRAVGLAPVGGHQVRPRGVRRRRLYLRIDEHGERPVCEFPAELVDERRHRNVEDAAVTAIRVAGLDGLDNSRDTDRVLGRQQSPDGVGVLRCECFGQRVG